MSDYRLARARIHRELLIGCGRRRDKRMWRTSDDFSGAGPASNREWKNLYTADINPECDPDFCVDLNVGPQWSPFEIRLKNWESLGILDEDGCFQESFFDEVHAYEILEHLGKLGDELSFFDHFSEIWRILKPGGYLLATVPSRFSEWLWGDPSHKRAIYPCTLTFLDQTEYVRQCDNDATRTPMSDFRSIYKADFKIVYTHDNKLTHSFILQAIKPSRIANAFKA